MTNEVVERFEKYVQARGFSRLGSENKRLLAQFHEWLQAEPRADYRAIVESLLKEADTGDYGIGSCEDLAWTAARNALNQQPPVKCDCLTTNGAHTVYCAMNRDLR